LEDISLMKPTSRSRSAFSRPPISHFAHQPMRQKPPEPFGRPSNPA
jgi:hypothetical protein